MCFLLTLANILKCNGQTELPGWTDEQNRLTMEISFLSNGCTLKLKTAFGSAQLEECWLSTSASWFRNSALSCQMALAAKLTRVFFPWVSDTYAGFLQQY